MHRMNSLLQSSEDIHSLDLVFFPMVNIDAYQLNLDALANKGAFGCRRTNMRAICPSVPEDDAGTCPYIPDQGIDINRNFPADFKSSDFGSLILAILDGVIQVRTNVLAVPNTWYQRVIEITNNHTEFHL